MISLFFAMIVGAHATSTNYKIVVENMITNEEKTFRVRNLSEAFRIPLPLSKIDCKLMKSDIWKKTNGGASLTCTDPNNESAISIYINCTTQPYIATQLFVTPQIENEYKKKHGIKISKEEQEFVDKNKNKNLMINSISLKIGCNVPYE